MPSSKRIEAAAFAKLLPRILNYPGNIVVVAGAGKGKTELAERIISAAMGGSALPSSYPIASTLGALRTWSAPSVLMAMVSQGIITKQRMDEFSSNVLSLCGITSGGDVVNRIAFSDSAAIKSVYSAAYMVGYGSQPAAASPSFLPLYYLIDDDGITHFDTPINRKGGAGVFIAWSDDSGILHEREELHIKSENGKRIDWNFANPSTVQGKRMIEKAIGEITGISSPSVVARKVIDEDRFVLVFGDDSMNGYSFAIGEGGLTTDLSAFDLPSDKKVDVKTLKTMMMAGFVAPASKLKLAGAPTFSNKQEENFVPTFDKMMKDNPVLALHNIVSSKCAADIISSAVGNSVHIASEIRSLLNDAGVNDGPVLIETEAKARGSYSFTAHNSSIEEDLTQLIINLGSRSINVTVSGSLLEACLGSMVLARPIHFSVLDMTAVRNIAVKTSTQKGGLDSGILNVMQFISNCATESGVVVVTETRDDFNAATDDDEEGIARAQSTLGANSRFAIHIMGTGSSRHIWMRGRGYGSFEDFTIKANGVELIHYPENKVKSLLPPLDLVALSSV